jgi:signal peptide peptidase SppA
MIERILAQLAGELWALDRRVLAKLREVIDRRATGAKLSEPEIEAALSAGKSPATDGDSEPVAPDGVAIVPIRGVISRRSGLIEKVSTGRATSVETIRKSIRAAARAKDITAVLLDVDSPGGAVSGVPELASEIADLAKKKPVIAHVDGGMMASAAYWLASGATKILATPSSQVGSIGVYTYIDDVHRHYEAAGVDTHLIATGRHKGVGVPGTRIESDQLDAIRASVEDVFGLFKSAVSSGRALDEDRMQSVCTGDCWYAASALSLGLVDGESSREEALAMLAEIAGARRKPPRARKETMDESEITTAAQLRAQFPQLVDQILTEDRETQAAAHGTAQASAVAEARAEGHTSGVTEERDRCSRIVRHSTDSQHALCAELIANGTDLVPSLEALLADPRRNASAILRADAQSAPDAIDGAAEDMAAAADESTLSLEERAKRMAAEQWKDPAKRALHKSQAGLEAFLKAKLAGLTCVR